MSTTTLTLRGLVLRRDSDEAVLSRALAGGEVAFAELYRRYSSRIYAYCLARLMDPHDAADAAQQVFIRVLRAKPEEIGTATAWLYTVARHVAIDVARARERQPDATDFAGDQADRLPATGDTADEFLRREEARGVFLALRRLRPRYRTALVLREIHGMSSAEIGEALELSPGAVDTLVSRARDSFAAAYAEAGSFPSDCRASVALIYRKAGTGISEAEQAALDGHLKTCSRCRAESARSAKSSHLAGLLPLFTPEMAGRLFPFSQALQVAVSSPEVMQRAPGIAGTFAAFAAAAIIALAPVALTASVPVARTSPVVESVQRERVMSRNGALGPDSAAFGTGPAARRAGVVVSPGPGPAATRGSGVTPGAGGSGAGGSGSGTSGGTGSGGSGSGGSGAGGSGGGTSGGTGSGGSGSGGSGASGSGDGTSGGSGGTSTGGSGSSGGSTGAGGSGSGTSGGTGGSGTSTSSGTGGSSH